MNDMQKTFIYIGLGVLISIAYLAGIILFLSSFFDTEDSFNDVHIVLDDVVPIENLSDWEKYIIVSQGSIVCTDEGYLVVSSQLLVSD